MFLVDDILLSPIKFPLYIIKKIHETAENEFTDKEKITSQLRELYLLVEAGKITEEDFNKKEAELLDQLEAIEEYEKGKQGVQEEGEYEGEGSEGQGEEEVRDV